jgi:hypothetical protein
MHCHANYTTIYTILIYTLYLCLPIYVCRPARCDSVLHVFLAPSVIVASLGGLRLLDKSKALRDNPGNGLSLDLCLVVNGVQAVLSHVLVEPLHNVPVLLLGCFLQLPQKHLEHKEIQKSSTSRQIYLELPDIELVQILLQFHHPHNHPFPPSLALAPLPPPHFMS